MNDKELIFTYIRGALELAILNKDGLAINKCLNLLDALIRGILPTINELREILT